MMLAFIKSSFMNKFRRNALTHIEQIVENVIDAADIW